MILQTQNHSLRPLTTAHLAQTMTLLELTTAELRQKVEAELASNPALELVEDKRCPTCHRRLPAAGPCPMCSRPVEGAGDQPIVFVSSSSDFHPSSERRSEEGQPREEWLAAVEDLPSYVLRQIAPEIDPADRPVVAHILTSLDEDGLLLVSPGEIARYHHIPLSRLEKLLQLIQHSDPLGVGSATPQEALLVQLEALSETHSIPPLASRAIREGMELLSRRAYPELGRLLGISTSKAQSTAHFIHENLNPYPARAHWGDSRHGAEPNPVYHNPDIIVTRLHGEPNSPLVVEVLAPFAGSLQINPLFREAIQQAPPDKAGQWQSDLEQASLLVKCLQQRNHTLVRLMQRIVVLQRDFILHGDACLLPVTRARLAVELGVHESTISRAVSGKALQLPNRRIVPLSKLFDPSLHIRTALREIITTESRPLSDAELSDLLSLQGFQVARRTVAKYRSMEGILPARLRHSPSL